MRRQVCSFQSEGITGSLGALAPSPKMQDANGKLTQTAALVLTGRENVEAISFWAELGDDNECQKPKL